MNFVQSCENQDVRKPLNLYFRNVGNFAPENNITNHLNPVKVTG